MENAHYRVKNDGLPKIINDIIILVGTNNFSSNHSPAAVANAIIQLADIINPGPKPSTHNYSIEIVDSHSLLAGYNMEGYLKKLIPLPSQVSSDVDCT